MFLIFNSSFLFFFNIKQNLSYRIEKKERELKRCERCLELSKLLKKSSKKTQEFVLTFGLFTNVTSYFPLLLTIKYLPKLATSLRVVIKLYRVTLNCLLSLKFPVVTNIWRTNDTLVLLLILYTFYMVRCK